MGVLTMSRSAESVLGTYTALVLVAGSIRCAPSLNASTLLRSRCAINITDSTLQNIKEHLSSIHVRNSVSISGVLPSLCGRFLG